MAKLVMLVDTKKCTGCHTCAMACKVENNLPNNVWWNQVFSGDVSDFKGDRATFTSGLLQKNANVKLDTTKGKLVHDGGVVNVPGNVKVSMNYYTKACQHCNKPLCLDICPQKAIYRDPVTGVIDTDFPKCIGCDACIQVCPYDVRHHNTETEAWYNKEVGGQGINKHKNNSVDKCTFCSHRLKEGLLPACIEHCPVGARTIGYISDPSSEVSRLLATRQHKRLLEDKGTDPSIYFLY